MFVRFCLIQGWVINSPLEITGKPEFRTRVNGREKVISPLIKKNRKKIVIETKTTWT